MLEWIAELGASAGTALMSAAGTDAWATAKSGVLRVFGRAGQQRERLAEGWLDEVATAIAAAGTGERDLLRRQLLPLWQTRLVDLLAEFPDAADGVRDWLDVVQAQLPAGPAAPRVQANVAMGGGTVFGVQDGALIVHHHGGAGSPGVPAPSAPDGMDRAG